MEPEQRATPSPDGRAAGERAAEEPEGGEAACLLHRVCPECGRLADDPRARECARCGRGLPPH
ncbi:hypothetical protein GCM10009716_07400 [Streptomyces sodiiphilus]|uniref:Zinc ribbon domain-containing protein n=1 Tax=Streptomyces sodiiphilus TaxID=226217 RepID=A0ABP5A474_9ACTN